MGTYATTTSLEIVMIGTTFDTATTSLATKLITRAENEVNKYLSKRYDLTSFNTSTSVPPLVTSLTEMIAEGHMHQSMSRGGKEAMARGDWLLKEAKSNLLQISKYELDLLDSTGTPLVDFSNSSGRVMCNTTDYSNTFNEDDELSWSVDDDKLDDIESGRD